MIAQVTQYLRPDGRKRIISMKLPDEYLFQYELIRSCGCTLACEQNAAGMIAQYITNDIGDFAIELTKAGDKEAAAEALCKMIAAFDKVKFEKWNEQLMAAMEGEEKAGPTGEFPDGKLSPEDDGELKYRIAADAEKKLVIVDFGVPVKWFAMPPEEAIVMGNALMDKAIELTD